MAVSTFDESQGGSQARRGSGIPTFVRNRQRLRKVAAIRRPGRFADIAAAIALGRSLFPWVKTPGTVMPESRYSPPVTSIAAAPSAARAWPGLGTRSDSFTEPAGPAPSP